MDDDFGPDLFVALHAAFKNLQQRDIDRLARGEAIGALQLNERGIAVFNRMPQQSNDAFRNHPEISNAEVVLVREVKELVDFTLQVVAEAHVTTTDLKAQVIETQSNYDCLLDFAAAVTRDCFPQFLDEALSDGDTQIARLLKIVGERIVADKVTNLNDRIVELEELAASRLSAFNKIVDKLDALMTRMTKLEQGNGNGDREAS
jgi:hypothetical protein